MPTIRRRGKRYQAQVRIKRDGAIVYENSATFDTERQARMWGDKLEDDFQKGKIKPDEPVLTVSQAIEHHRESMLKDGRDIRGVTHTLDCLKDHGLGEKDLLKIQAGDIVEWAKEYAIGGKSGRSPATVRHALMNLRTVYSTARVELKVKVDVQEVADAVEHLTKRGLCANSMQRDRRVTDDEVDAICKWHEGLGGTMIPLRLIMNLLIALPRRRGEVISGMLWENYDRETVKLLDTKDPTQIRNEIVPIPPEARAIISKLPRAKAGYILPYTPNSVSSAMARAADMLGIEDLHLHDLRHEGISRLFEKGLDIPQVAMISGHKSWATLKRYTHLKPTDVVKRMVELA
ncbi:site-specific integrase [Rhodoferax sp. GW822-FHT02A01]|uniref:tyrosine-type recombinase/integrase n=1 Tax=Rhodoferax sp. GW822-FHT02A01 TaxID=3141537 RepID=UPI00315CDAA1